jgi:hypothetical protein
MTAPARFTQADITRLIKGAMAAGLQVRAIRVAPTGEIVVSADAEVQIAESHVNPLDRLLNHGAT